MVTKPSTKAYSFALGLWLLTSMTLAAVMLQAATPAFGWELAGGLAVTGVSLVPMGWALLTILLGASRGALVLAWSILPVVCLVDSAAFTTNAIFQEQWILLGLPLALVLALLSSLLALQWPARRELADGLPGGNDTSSPNPKPWRSEGQLLISGLCLWGGAFFLLLQMVEGWITLGFGLILAVRSVLVIHFSHARAIYALEASNLLVAMFVGVLATTAAHVMWQTQLLAALIGLYAALALVATALRAREAGRADDPAP